MRKRNNIPLLLVASEEIETMSVRKWKWTQKRKMKNEGRRGRWMLLKRANNSMLRESGDFFFAQAMDGAPFLSLTTKWGELGKIEKC